MPQRPRRSADPTAAPTRRIDRRVAILAVAAFAGAVIAGLAVPGVIGGVILIVVAAALALLTAAVRGRGVDFDNRNWALRVLVIMALAALGLIKLVKH